MVTLDDDLFSTRAMNSQVNTISNRKADNEGHSADAVANAFLRVIIALRFRRRGESQEENVRTLFKKLVEGKGRNLLLVVL